jgi:serine/threonine-protein kinase HipA
MIDPDSLNVWFEDQLVGHLWRTTTNAVGFRYASDWIAQNGFAISQTLTITEEKFTPGEYPALQRIEKIVRLQCR